MKCEEVREHLESCGECHLYIEVEARLRALPVVDPPAPLTGRLLRVLPRPAGSLGKEAARLAAAAAALLALTGALFLTGLDRHPTAREARDQGSRILQSMVTALNPLRSEWPWNR